MNWRASGSDDISSQPIVFGNFEAMLLQAATAEGERPSIDNLPSDGSLVSRVRTDDMGEKSINWYGRSSFIADMSRNERMSQAEQVTFENLPYLETFMVACIDAALAAQNAVVAAESLIRRTTWR